MNLISEEYLMHHGVKGMKWGVRHDKPRNYVKTGNGSANNPYRIHDKNSKKSKLASDYRAHKLTLSNYNMKISSEGQKLMNKSKGLSDDFGKTYSNVDDEEFFELIARTERKLDTSSYWKAVQQRDSWYAAQDKKAIRLGKKYASKGY